MSENVFLGIVISTNATLAGVIVWLVKAWRRDTTTIVNQCRNSLDANTRVVEKVIDLLTNWRGH